MPEVQYQAEEPDHKYLEVEGVEVSFGPSGGQWKHSYDGEDAWIRADWEHGDNRPHENQSVSMSESDRQLSNMIAKDVAQFLHPKDGNLQYQ